MQNWRSSTLSLCSRAGGSASRGGARPGRGGAGGSVEWPGTCGELKLRRRSSGRGCSGGSREAAVQSDGDSEQGRQRGERERERGSSGRERGGSSTGFYRARRERRGRAGEEWPSMAINGGH
jgi:hypothetical protein